MPFCPFFLFLLVGGVIHGETFTLTGSMKEGRTVHATVLLSDGRVLVVGGATPVGRSNTAELYDPATGQWRYTFHNMNVARESPSAVRLLDGSVLVIGGRDERSVELFDPVAETFLPVSSMLSILGPNLAFRLLNGKVLVARVADQATSGVELFDPVTRQWTMAAPLPSGGFGPAGAVLSDGRVLLTGGLPGSGNYVALYDPPTNGWRAMAGLLDGSRWECNATLLPNGKVLVTSGIISASFQTLSSNKTELYDVSAPPNGSSAFGPDLFGSNQGNSPGGNGHRATALSNGNVLITGGSYSPAFNAQPAPVSGAILFDYVANSNVGIGSMQVARAHHTTTLLQDGRVLLAGGETAGAPTTSTAELWGTAATGTISVTTNLSTSTFAVSGPKGFSGGGLSTGPISAPAGTYTVSYLGPASYVVPPQQTAVLSPGQAINFYGEFRLRTGRLTVSSTLPGTTFAVSGPVGLSGLIGNVPLTYTLPIGAYTVSFAPAVGYVTPLPQNVAVFEATSQAVSGNYSLIAGLGTVVVTLNAPFASFDMTGPITFSGLASTTFSNATPGAYSVQFIPSISSGLPRPPIQNKTLFAADRLLFSSKTIPSTVPIKVVSPGTETCKPIAPLLSFGGDVCISFEAKPGAPAGRLKGIVHILNGTGAWYSATIVRPASSVMITDQQLPSVFLLPPRGANGYFDSDPTLFVEFGLGDSLVIDLQRDSIAAAGVFLIDFLSRVFLGKELDTFSSKGFLSLVDGGVIPAALDTIKSECANSFLSLLYDSANPATNWNDLGSALTCVAQDDLAKGAFLRILDKLMTVQQKNALVNVLEKAGETFSFISYLQHAVSATEAFGGYYAAPAHGQIRLDAVSRGQ